jgi:transposase
LASPTSFHAERDRRKLAKTDRIDAENLAHMGVVLKLETRQPLDESANELKELYMARDALIKDRTAAKNRAQDLTSITLRVKRSSEAIDT